jgi:mannose-1-phosphate guanylyltransferase
MPANPCQELLIGTNASWNRSVVAMAAAAIQKRDPLAVMAVLTADHYIRDVVAFPISFQGCQAGG